MSLELRVRRVALKPTYTIGKLEWTEDGKVWNYLCDTLEDKVRDYNKDGDLEDKGETKIYGETAIPYGKYTFTVEMSPKFGYACPLLHNVKHFEYIRVHKGNTAVDTHGCVLVGKNTEVGKLGAGTSGPAFEKLMDLLDRHPQRSYTIEIL